MPNRLILPLQNFVAAITVVTVLTMTIVLMIIIAVFVFEIFVTNACQWGVGS